jgi:hypothetical protein
MGTVMNGLDITFGSTLGADRTSISGQDSRHR